MAEPAAATSDFARAPEVRARVSLEFRDPVEGLVRGPLASLWDVPFERRPPVRRIRARKGQRNFTGSWWAATTGEHIDFESWLERDHLMMLDFDSTVVGISSRPFWLHWTTEGKRRRRAPDFFVRRADGSVLVVDVHSREPLSATAAADFVLTEHACTTVGWHYRRVGPIDPLKAANMRWLAGYRHQRCFDAQLAAALQRAFAFPRRLSDGLDEIGDPIAVRPVAFHLLWTGTLTTELDTQLLGASSIVVASDRGRR